MISLTDEEKGRGVTLSEKLADLYIPAAKQGAILTMSCHMPNFAEVAQRGKVNGKYDFGGYSPNNLQGNVMQRIMPSGDLHEVYNAYLDMVAEFDSRLQAANIPLLFRPFHENNGSWFWWGPLAVPQVSIRMCSAIPWSISGMLGDYTICCMYILQEGLWRIKLIISPVIQGMHLLMWLVLICTIEMPLRMICGWMVLPRP